MIAIATLVPDTLQPAGIGTRNAQIGTVELRGNRHRAYLKKLSPEATAAECFCALILRGWGLDVPEPILVEYQGDQWFGSLDAGYPNIKKRLRIDDALPEAARKTLLIAASALVSSFASTPRALAADEAIANGDRNLENILWDGDEPAWIDHERALGLPEGSDQNKLALMAMAAGRVEDVQRGAVAAALTLARDIVEDISKGLPFEADRFAELVNRRLASLGNLVVARFPAPEHDLFR